MKRCKRFLPACGVGVACAASLLLTFAPHTARADDTIKQPGAHPAYNVEIEPHGLLDPWNDVYGTAGFGLGARFGIPIVANGFIPSINNSVAISFGADWVHYGCYDNFSGCSADYLEFPVTLQWNFYVSQHWSVFGEPGLYIYHGFFNDDCNVAGLGPGQCLVHTETGVLPAFYAGARYHFSDSVSLTMRVGFPSTSIGVSFFL
jgi:hypothetical protein